MKRWLALILAFATLAGCQPVYLTKEAMEQAHEGLPRHLEVSPERLMSPLSKMTSAPATVSDPERSPRYLELQEAIAIALESGVVSGRGVSNLFGLIPSPGGGAPITTALGFAPASQNDSMRIITLNPAATFTGIEQSVARFDPVFSVFSTWTGITGIPGVPNLGSNFADNSLFQSSTGGHNARVGAAIVKGLPTGGIAELSFLTDYRFINNTNIDPAAAGFGRVNPQYSVRPSLSIEHPLWRDFGEAINQLLPIFPQISGLGLSDSHVGSAFNQHQGRVGTDGILIARLKFDQSRAHLENNVNALMANVEIAYWNLYNKYGQLYAFEENLRIMHASWQEAYSKYKAGGGGGQKIQEYFQVRGQYEEFRGERLRALNEVIEAERNLRSILGLSIEDGTRLVPTTAPTLAQVKPSWETSLQDALTVRPDLEWLRQELKRNEFNLKVQLNNLKPDLRMIARFNPYGDGSTLTGSGTFVDSAGATRESNALSSLTHAHLADWQVGVTLNMPLGFRAEYAAIRSARLELTKSYLLLKDAESQVVFQLGKEFQDVEHWYKRIGVHRAERNGYRDAMVTLYNLKQAGTKTLGDPQFLEVQRRYAAALTKEYQAIAEYNNSLARLEWAKGTIMRHNNVHISEGMLPQCAQVRAVEYEKERSRSLVLRSRPDSLSQPGLLGGYKVTAPKELEAPPEEERTVMPNPIMPARYEEPGKGPILPTTPPTRDETPVKFRPSAAPKAPGPLPKLEPLPTLITPNTSALPTAPGFGSPQVGYVLPEAPAAYSSRVGPQGRTEIAPTAVRAAIGGPESIR